MIWIGSLRVLDSKDGSDRTPRSLAELGDIQTFRFAPDGKSLAVLFNEGRRRPAVGVWHLPDGRQIGMLEGPGWMRSYSFNSASNQLAVPMENNTIELLDLRTGKVTVLRTNGPIEVVEFSPDGGLLAAADTKGLVILVELSSLSS